MTTHRIECTTTDRELTVLVETMPEVSSVGYCLLLPCGSVYDPPLANGTAAVVCEWLPRGAGEWSNRELANAFDRLGVQGNTYITAHHLTLSGACVAAHFPEAMRLYGQILARPLLDEEEFEHAWSSCEQTLQAAQDDPRQQLSRELQRRIYPPPLNQLADGALEDLERITPDSATAHLRQHVRPNGAILGVAGNVTLTEVLQTLEHAWAEWQPVRQPLITIERDHPLADLPARVERESLQTQLGMAFAAVPPSDPNFFAASAVTDILGGSAASRLFEALRERQSLCYSVHATLSNVCGLARIVCLVGSTHDQAEAARTALHAELTHLGEHGITAAELKRFQTRARTSLVVDDESTSGRAASLARSWHHLRRPVSTEDDLRSIAALTVDQVNEYLKQYPPTILRELTIGPASPIPPS